MTDAFVGLDASSGEARGKADVMNHQARRIVVTVCATVACVGGGVGCSSKGDTRVALGPDAGTSPIVFVGGDEGYPPGMVQVTSVRFRNDGTKKVTTKLITKEQAATSRVRRESNLAASKNVDTGDGTDALRTRRGSGDDGMRRAGSLDVDVQRRRLFDVPRNDLFLQRGCHAG
jgi:hypothetical protein